MPPRVMYGYGKVHMNFSLLLSGASHSKTCQNTTPNRKMTGVCALSAFSLSHFFCTSTSICCSKSLLHQGPQTLSQPSIFCKLQVLAVLCLPSVAIACLQVLTAMVGAQAFGSGAATPPGQHGLQLRSATAPISEVREICTNH